MLRANPKTKLCLGQTVIYYYASDKSYEESVKFVTKDENRDKTRLYLFVLI